MKTISVSAFAAPADRAVLDRFAAAGVTRSILRLPSEGRDKILPLLDSTPSSSSRLRKKRMTTALLFSTRCARGPLSEWKDAQEPSRAADCGPRRDRPRRAETVPGRSRALGREGSNPDQVVRGEGKCKHPVHAAGAPVPRLAHQPDGFEPAEDL